MPVYSDTTRAGDLDEYTTPRRLVDAVLNCIPFFRFDTFSVLDPGCNRGQWGSRLKLAYPKAQVTGLEYMRIPSQYRMEGYDDFIDGTNYLTWDTDQRYTLVIGNPPYSKPETAMADKFVEKSMELLKPEGWLFFLLRLNFGCSSQRMRDYPAEKQAGRKGLFQRFPLTSVSFAERPSFYKHDRREVKHYGKSSSPAHDYALYVWQKGVSPPVMKSYFLQWKHFPGDDEYDTLHGKDTA